MQNKKAFRLSGEYSAFIWLAAIGIVCFAAHILVTEITELSPAVSGLIFLCSFIAAASAVGFVLYRIKAKSGTVKEQLSTNANTIRDLLQQAHMPIMLTDGTGKIIWYNDDLAISFEVGMSAIGTSMHVFCKPSEAQLLEATSAYYGDTSAAPSFDDSITDMTIAGRRYRASCYRVRTSIKSKDDIRDFYMTMFSDTTDLYNASELIRNAAPAVAYVIVDNLEELAQNIKVGYREQANRVEQILKEWSDSMHGTIREYSRDKYMMIFSRDMLDECIADKFSVLDKIREIRIGEGDSSLPVTVSMGIAASRPAVGNDISLDLTATAQEAASALDMALQRGGDQAAVKTEAGLECFGGRTKSIQKRTRVRARVIAGKLCGLIAKSTRVLIMGHKNPDFDSVGACVGLARLCMFCGVDCKIIVDKANQNFRICTEKLLSHPDYADMFIDRAEAVDLLSPSTLLIIADANNFSIIEAPEIATNAKTIYIVDHHRQTTELPETVVTPPYIDPAASSACELVAEILEQCLPAGALHSEEANVMISGIMVDTKNFTRTTSTRTFGAALYLRGEGANTEITRTFFDEEFEDYMAEAKFGTDVKIYRDSIAITKSDGTDNGYDRVAAAKSADRLLTIRSVDAAFALVRVGDIINISARSNGKINVQLILEKIGGGGHFDVAGAQLEDGSLEKAEKLLRDAIDDYFDNNL
ncbi:MAG: hypothetical protein E7640_02475 [Ruminococcaceae bacterium]|nr:hypothetical protein [Oscillospiraceae bacterium]